MNSHFEVILERVKQLSNISKKTVWFELHDTDSKTPSMVLINANNDIGLISMNFKGKIPTMTGHILTKKVYDDLIEQQIDIQKTLGNLDTSTSVKDLVHTIAC